MEVKVAIFCTLFIGYAFYAYNRKSVSLVLPKLIEEGLDKSEVGLIISTQNIAYAISKFVGGVLSDKFSARHLFTWGLVISGLSTVLFSGSTSALTFCFLWFVNGLAQGCGWPACAKMLRKWFSSRHFATLWSILSSSANVSGAASPFISAFLTLNYGWRFSLLVAGVTSVVFGVLSLLILADSPAHEKVSTKTKVKHSAEKEKKEVKTSVEKKSNSNLQNETFATLIQSPFLWLVSISYLVVFCGKTSAIDWGQMYLMEDRKQSQYAASAFTSSVESGGFLGGVLAGYLTDWALKWKSSGQGNPRMSVAVYFMIGVMTCLHLLQFTVTESTSQLWIATLGFLLGACFYGPIAIYGVVASENAPSHLSGTAHAIVALAANVGAIISGLPFSFIAKYYNWSAIFFILEMVTGITVIAMLIFRNISSSMGKVKEE